ncbi:MAG TPA: GNAT family N-acetyltransferase [Oscillospiraceae bacterium]|nr:GNAT family N-acetyltransferase [Oscillospiraceae bacterium]HRW56814.1 GNAT family N-acetyltransferase [Oscillospiraceae bacterium]
MGFVSESYVKANQIDIVKAVPEKIEEYKRIFDNSALYTHYFKKNPELLDKWLTENIAAGQAYMALDRDGSVVGWISFKMDGMFGYPDVTLLGVKDTCRGRGIGELLIQFYLGVAGCMGYKEAGIVVNDWNPRARKLYTRMGFFHKKSFEDPYIGGFEDHLLIRKI